MSKEKSPAKSISFSWAPTPYPVEWADSPEEVPEWDTSRGCPLGVHAQHLKEWEVKPAPESGYPRLVRRSLEGLITPRNRAGEDVVNDLLKLYKHIPAWREGKPVAKLRRDVQGLAEKYGAPGRHDENTLAEWLVLAAYIQTYMWALAKLEPDFDPYHLLHRRAALEGDIRGEREGFSVVEVGFIHRERRTYKGAEAFTALASMLDSLNALAKTPQFRSPEEDKPDIHDPRRGVIEALEELIRLADKVEDEVEPEKRTAAFRLEVASGLYNQFGRAVAAYKNSEGLPLHFIPTAEWGIVLWCPLSIWVGYKLSEAWRYGAPVEPCPVCGELFMPTHGNRKYCKSGTCAYKAHKQNQKARAAQP